MLDNAKLSLLHYQAMNVSKPVQVVRNYSSSKWKCINWKLAAIKFLVDNKYAWGKYIQEMLQMLATSLWL